VKNAFDGIGRAGRRAKVVRAINNSTTTTAQDAHEFEGAIVDDGTDSRGTRKTLRKTVRRHTVGEGLQNLQGGMWDALLRGEVMMSWGRKD
jgi:hypothetical protein